MPLTKTEYHTFGAILKRVLAHEVFTSVSEYWRINIVLVEYVVASISRDSVQT